MATLFVRHTVNDFAAWKQIYDSYSDEQKEAGVTWQAVYQAADNQNDVTVVHEFATMDQAKAFVEDPRLKAATQEGGVIGAPAIWFTSKV